MADSNIGALPQVQGLYDDSLLVVEQQGQAMKATGAQFKEFGRQAVIGQVQGYVDAAQAAADSAAGAVSAVIDMTVSAHTSDTATVIKSTREGKVNLEFGLPRGEQGIPGPEGQQGPRGPQGAPGNGLTILGHYDTEAVLRASVKAPAAGDAYGVGVETPYDTYIFDGVTNDWKNYGPLSGGGGVIPENVVIAEGGAVLEIPAGLGDAPHTIEFTEEEEPPLTAEDIVCGEGTVQEALNNLFTSVSDGKALIASAVTDRGVPTAQDATFQEMADNIGQIQGGADTSDATANPGDILAGKTAYTASGKVEGIIPSLPAQVITPGTADKTIANGQYLAGTQTIQGDTNLTSANIKKGVTLFGVAGALDSAFTATLTVTADIGAVVTATCGDTSVEALSTTGQVVLELPIEGTWKVTAVRGVAQYNTVTVEVSSSYSAELTAEVHIVRYGYAEALSALQYNLASVSIESFALFAGGNNRSDSYESKVVNAYNKDLVKTNPEELNIARHALAAARVGEYALLGGGYIGSKGTVSDAVDAYDAELTHTTPTVLSEARGSLAAATIGDYALFGGGESGSTVVDAYNASLTRSTLTVLQLGGALFAASNANYAIFAGEHVTAYNKFLTRETPVDLSVLRSTFVAAAAGNYVLFAGGYNITTIATVFSTVDAYDLFLTRTTPESLGTARRNLAGTTLMGFALFCGGEGTRTASWVGTADAYDPYLVHTTPDPLGRARRNLAASSIGDYALFGGGYGSDGSAYLGFDTVDVYKYV